MDLFQQGTPVVVVPGFPFPTEIVENPLASSIGTTVQRIFVNNANRVFWYLENRSSVPLFIGFSTAASSAAGILVDANGGWVSMALAEDGEAIYKEVWALGTAAGQSIYSFEINRDLSVQVGR